MVQEQPSIIVRWGAAAEKAERGWLQARQDQARMVDILNRAAIGDENLRRACLTLIDYLALEITILERDK